MSGRRLRPLTVAQILSSAAGAVPVIVAALRMDPDSFTTFSVLALAGALSVGGSRALLFQPALLHQRVNSACLVPARYMVVAAVGGVLVGAVVATGVGQRDPITLVAACAATSLPIVYDWSRYRAIGTGHRWAVALGDAVRLLTVAAVVLPTFAVTTEAFLFMIAISTAVATVPILVRVPLRVRAVAYRDYAASAGWQGLDFAVGQLIVSVPLIVLAGTGSDLLIGGVRLAQTLLGPLNLAFAAASANIVADGATDAAYRRASAVIQRGWRSSVRLLALSTAGVGCVLLGVMLTGFTTRGVDHDDLVLGLALVGGATILTGWSGIHAIVLRVLDHQASVTVTRIGIAFATVVGFVLGFAAEGEQASIVVGYLANGVSAPLLLMPVALFLYRRESRDGGT